jgi:hypothetical protein
VTDVFLYMCTDKEFVYGVTASDIFVSKIEIPLQFTEKCKLKKSLPFTSFNNDLCKFKGKMYIFIDIFSRLFFSCNFV